MPNRILFVRNRLLLVAVWHIKTNLGTGNVSRVAIAARRWLDSVSRPETKNRIVEIVSESCSPKDAHHVLNRLQVRTHRNPCNYVFGDVPGLQYRMRNSNIISQKHIIIIIIIYFWRRTPRSIVFITRKYIQLYNTLNWDIMNLE